MLRGAVRSKSGSMRDIIHVCDCSDFVGRQFPTRTTYSTYVLRESMRLQSKGLWTLENVFYYQETDDPAWSWSYTLHELFLRGCEGLRLI